MTAQQLEPQLPQPRSIRRQQVQQYLMISAFVATQVVTGCSDLADTKDNPPVQAQQMVPARFYENQAQCAADAQTQQSQYAAQLQAYQEQQAKPAPPMPLPQPPALKVADCAAWMAAAQKEHDRHAPVYRTLEDCQAERVQCESTSGTQTTRYTSGTQTTGSGYRPRFGGAYSFPSGQPSGNSAEFSSGSGPQNLTPNPSPHTVYRGAVPGEIVTPQGEILAKPNAGLVSVPESTSMAAPSRPAGSAASGTITGRSSSGFGSTYKSTGRGGK
jgi:uncharacterized protein YgiB involved in biofilm formation